MDVLAIIWLIFPLALIAGAVSDLLRYEIPNSLSVSLLLGYVAYAYAAEIGFDAAMQSLASSLVVLLSGLILFRFAFLGGGDVKLLAAASPWVGWEGLPAFLIFTALWGGVLAMILLICRELGKRKQVLGPQWWQRLLEIDRGVPYGIAICAGGLTTWVGFINPT